LLSATAFVLRLHPYEVVAVRDSTAVSLLAGDPESAFVCGVLLHVQQGDSAGRLIHRILEVASNLPVLLVDRTGDLAPVCYADMVLYGLNTSTAHILAALKVLSQRRCGPHPRQEQRS
jgi:hypothetical protein